MDAIRARTIKSVARPVAIVVMATSLGLTQPAAAQPCAGDCNGNGEVTVGEIVLGVNIALGGAQVGNCPTMDSNGDGRVSVGEIIAAVNNALCGCLPCPPPPPTATPTRTPPSTQTPTPAVTSTSTPPTPGEVLFSEGWQRARVGVYRPRAESPLGGDVIAADTGDWIVGDTVTQFDDCGTSPHFAEIIMEDGSRRLRLHSGNSNSDCADNVDIAAIMRNPPSLRGLDVDLTADVFLSFRETGELLANKDCDAVYFTLEFDNAARLNYVLQRGPLWDEDPSNCGDLFFTHDVLLLDPTEVTYTRNILEDAAAAGFETPRRVTFIGFSVDSEGTGTFDDIRFFRAR